MKAFLTVLFLFATVEAASAKGWCVLDVLMWPPNYPNDTYRVVSRPLPSRDDWQCHSNKPRYPTYLKNLMGFYGNAVANAYFTQNYNDAKRHIERTLRDGKYGLAEGNYQLQ